MTQELGRPRRSKGVVPLAQLAALAAFACFAPHDAAATATASLSWTPSTSPTVAGYHLYYGVASTVYTNFEDAGALNSVTVSNLAPGTTYFFAATAYDSVGLESPFSNEVSYSVPRPTLVAVANNQSSVYGASNVSLTGSLSGVQPGDNITVTFTTSASTSSPVGTYPITPVLSDPNGKLANYTVALTNGTLTILPDTATGALSSSANPCPPGQPVTFSLSVSAAPPGSGTPTGTAQILVDGVAVGSPVVLNNGTANYTTASLAHGFHTVAARYSGDGNFIAATAPLGSSELINTPPTAGPCAISSVPASIAKIPLPTLLANCTDADGDTVSLVGVSATSANGGLVVTNAGWIIYTPLPGSTNSDTFGYSITDSYGVQVPGTVTVNALRACESTPNLVSSNTGANSYTVSGNGIPGRTYTIQFSDPPGGTWQTLAPALPDDTGFLQLTDSSGNPQRVYRSVYP